MKRRLIKIPPCEVSGGFGIMCGVAVRWVMA